MTLKDQAIDTLTRSMREAARGRDFRRIEYGDSMQPAVGQTREQIRQRAQNVISPTYPCVVVVYDGILQDGRSAAICDAWDSRTGESVSVAQPYRKTILGAWKAQGAPVNVGQAPEALTVPPTPSDLGIAARDGNGKGAEIMAVVPGSAADQAGLTVGDIVTLLGEQRISSYGDLVWGCKSVKYDTILALNYIRDDGQRITSIELMNDDSP